MAVKVSVIMITYKHEAFIEEAINGVLMQEGDFDLELIIGDDCSPDNTMLIVNSIILNNAKGNIIKYYRHEVNIGMMSNFAFCYSKSSGEYIALCEGDDYWIRPNKIKEQVAFLNKNKEYVLLTSNAHILEGNILQAFDCKNINKTFTQNDQISKNQCITCTVMFRKIIPIIPNWMSHLPIGDYPLFIMVLEHGLGFHKNTIDSVYRLHSGGVYSSLADKNKIINEIHVLESLRKNEIKLKNIHTALKLQYLYYDLFCNYKNINKLKLINKIIKLSFKGGNKSLVISLKTIFKLLKYKK